MFLVHTRWRGNRLSTRQCYAALTRHEMGERTKFPTLASENQKKIGKKTRIYYHFNNCAQFPRSHASASMTLMQQAREKQKKAMMGAITLPTLYLCENNIPLT